MKFETGMELVPVGECEECGERIYPGDKNLEIDGYRLCPACVKSMNGEDMMKFLGFDLEEAKEDEE